MDARTGALFGSITLTSTFAQSGTLESGRTSKDALAQLINTMEAPEALNLIRTSRQECDLSCGRQRTDSLLSLDDWLDHIAVVEIIEQQLKHFKGVHATLSRRRDHPQGSAALANIRIVEHLMLPQFSHHRPRPKRRHV